MSALAQPLPPDVDRQLDSGRAEPLRVLSLRRGVAQITARRIAAVACRDELAVTRESLWSELLDLDVWRRDVTTRCRSTQRRYRELVEERATDRAAAPTVC